MKDNITNNIITCNWPMQERRQANQKCARFYFKIIEVEIAITNAFRPSLITETSIKEAEMMSKYQACPTNGQNRN